MLKTRNHFCPRSTALGVAPLRYLMVAFVIAGMGNAARADDGPSYKLSGFGTVAAVHSNDSGSDFLGSALQPNGAGHTSAWSLNTDSKLGVQADGKLNDTFSAVVQIVSQHQYDDTFTPHVEWANIKYQATSELSVRVGRIAAPSYLLSESRFVGYASPWVRPPQEVYSILYITSNDGIDATYRTAIAGVNHSIQGYAGKSMVGLFGQQKINSKLSWGLNDTAEFGSFTLRAGYNSLKQDFHLPSVQPLLDGLSAFSAAAASVPLAPYQAVAAQTAALASKYRLDKISVSVLALGVTYDPGSWFVMSEFVGTKATSLVSNSTSWYASGGYRFGSLTPYATYSTTNPRIHHQSIDTTGAAPLAAGAAAVAGGINAVLDAFTINQHTSTAGIRWDAMKNLALKAQYDAVTVGSASAGHFVDYAGVTPSKHPHVISLAADFVF